MINDVLSSDTLSAESSGLNMGLHIGYSGGITPTGGIDFSQTEENKEFREFISGIKGNKVSIKVGELTYSTDQISGEELKIESGKTTVKEELQGSENKKGFSFVASASVGLDGKLRSDITARYQDNDFVISGYYSPDLVEGWEKLTEKIKKQDVEDRESGPTKELGGKTDKPHLKPSTKPNGKEIPVKDGDNLWNLWEREGKPLGISWSKFKKDNAHIEQKYGTLNEMHKGDVVYADTNGINPKQQSININDKKASNTDKKPTLTADTSSPKPQETPSTCTADTYKSDIGQALEKNNIELKESPIPKDKLDAKNENTKKLTPNQKLVFADAGYYEEEEAKNTLKKGGEENSKVIYVFTDKKQGSNGVIIENGRGVLSYNVAGTHPPTWDKDDIREFVKDLPTDTRILFNSLDGDLKYRTYEIISNIEKYNKETGNNQPLILNGHSAGGPPAFFAGLLRPDLIREVNKVDSPGVYKMALELYNGDTKKAQEAYKNVNIYNANKNLINSVGDHAPGKMAYNINADKHAADKIRKSYEKMGSTQILARCYTSLCNYKNGEYTVRVQNDKFATEASVAEYYGVRDDQVKLTYESTYMSTGIFGGDIGKEKIFKITEIKDHNE